MTRAALLLALLFAACGEPVAPAPDAGVDAGPVDGGGSCYDPAHPEKGRKWGEACAFEVCACPNVCRRNMDDYYPGTSQPAWYCVSPSWDNP